MKKIITSTIFLLLGFIQTFACELCKSHQPEILQDIAHGTGPQGTMDYVILWTAAVIVFITLVLSILFLVRPNKLDKNYQIKFLPVNENF